MAATAATRKTISIHDYPEHLNPFREDDNHNRIRFWTIGRKLNRSNSITFTGIKDLRNSRVFRSFMKKGKKEQQSSSQDKSNNHVANGETSPIVYRRALQYSTGGTRTTIGSPGDRYVYGGSVTPLPRSRFQERLRSPSQYEVNSLSVTPRMARSEITGSRLSVESTNPFDEEPIPPVRTFRRKKKRAPPPPPGTTGTSDVLVSTESTESQTTEDNSSKHKDSKDPNTELEGEDINLNVELKIVEDEDDESKYSETKTPNTYQNNESSTTLIVEKKDADSEDTTNGEKAEVIKKEDSNLVKQSGSDEDIESVPFPKIDITKYRRNSSVNDDDIRLRRGNLEDFHTLTNKRSKSLTNDLDTSYMAYDINLNEHTTHIDANGNEEPQKVICKLYDETRKQSIDTVSSTEKEFIEIDKATRELEREISKLNYALTEDDLPGVGDRLSVSEIKRRFDKNDVSSPNPIPKPRRSHYGGSSSP